jgi:hypothetical protein
VARAWRGASAAPRGIAQWRSARAPAMRIARLASVADSASA